MLVLSRKINERILIGNHIRVTIVSTRGNQVRIGIEAPSDVPIFREELLVPTLRTPMGGRGENEPGSRRTPPVHRDRGPDIYNR